VSLSPLAGFLAIAVDNGLCDVIVSFQFIIALLYLTKAFRNSQMSAPLIVISLLMFPVLLMTGLCYAARSDTTTLSSLETFLAYMAGSPFSWIFYLVAVFQCLIAALCVKKAGFRDRSISIPVIVASLLILPASLAVGFHYAAQPDA
jgi:hypothetical protein